LLKLYSPQEGSIWIGDTPFDRIPHRYWRRKCGVVLQDGYVFSDTIARNISLSSEEIDMSRLEHAARVANLEEFIQRSPKGFERVVGAAGEGLSQGRKQRLLIARAVYANPEYFFFDEATNALDATNEAEIMLKLRKVCGGKTVVTVAHRLSTVRHADQIVVLDKGRIIESGTHDELTQLRGAYFSLVKNQLELAEA
jgi:ATP-binding cassette, subfamily B, bacterial